MFIRAKLLDALRATLPRMRCYAPKQLPQVNIDLWQELVMHQSVQRLMGRNGLPRALEPAQTFYKVERQSHPYTVISIDGSQIYPDRHHGLADCFALNIGHCTIAYRTTTSSMLAESHPSVHLAHEALPIELGPLFSADTVDLLREQSELEHGLRLAQLQKTDNGPYIVLFDGTLIFSHLEGKHELLKTHFLGKYLQQLKNLHTHGVCHGAYLSAARTKDLTLLLLQASAEKDASPALQNIGPLLEGCTDIQLLRNALIPGQRTAIFVSNVGIAQWYPKALAPCFAYLHSGKELVRIEFPLWIAQNASMLDTIMAIALDQTEKGQGYPVCLAHAHQQAVINAADKQFFYHLMQRSLMQEGGHMVTSAKQRKKEHLEI